MPPHSGFPALLFQLQCAQFLLPAFLFVPQLLAVLVHAQTVGAHHVQVFVAPQRKLLRMLRQPRVPVSRLEGRGWIGQGPPAEKPGSSDPSRARVPQGDVMVWAVVLMVAGLVEAVIGDNVKMVSDQDLAVGVLQAGARVDTRVRELQALDQQTVLHVEGAVVITGRELFGFLSVTLCEL